MLPSVVGREVQEGLESYLTFGFEPSNPFFSGIVRTFACQPGNLVKGPYLSLGLPFRAGNPSRAFFSVVRPELVPHVHQEAAWHRLRSDAGPRSTLIATGTGSGKTECFLFPLLDHCAGEHLAGRSAGIKALVIYPMNALANDQARRFAKTIFASDALRGRVRVGLFVGEGEGRAAGTEEMGPESVITNKEVMRRDPPDVLLTNYKMLDYLLIRPRDRELWRFNRPDTLRYLVVDELHTFDGAQGTDLALLIRRLKARLGAAQDGVVCVGTSATLGGKEDGPVLIDYARQVFDAPFDADAIFGESRQTMAEFVGSETIDYQLSPQPDLEERLAAARRATLREAVAIWYRLFFPDDEEAARPDDGAWRTELGEKLKRQFQFNNLLRALERQPRGLDEIAQDLARSLPAPIRPLSRDVLDALCALTSHAFDPGSWARDPTRPNPLVQLRLVLWVRELRRMVVPVRRSRDEIRLLSADDLQESRTQVYLPLVQCRECHATAWLGRIPPGQQRVDSDLRGIYNAFFQHASDAALFYPEMTADAAFGARSVTGHLCGACGHFQSRPDSCEGCGSDQLVAALRPMTQRQVQRGNATRIVSDHICPSCGTQDSLILFGARATSLSAVSIQHLWASRFNDDKKLIAFSDSVQDAAHRAGFFAARTWANTVRMAIAQALSAGRSERMPWQQFLEELPAYWLDATRNPRAMTPERFVTELIGPNMLALDDYERLLETGRLDADGWLLDSVKKRLQWEAFAEFGYQSRRGRSLERVGCAALGIDPGRVQAAVTEALPLLAEHLGLRDLSAEELSHFVWGFVLHLKQRGAIDDPVLDTYITSGGRSFVLSRLPFLPGFGPESPQPIFLSLAPRHPEFDTVVANHGRTWYQHWLKRTLGKSRLLANDIELDIYRPVIDALTRAGVLFQKDVANGPIVGLDPKACFVSVNIARLVTDKEASELFVPRELLQWVTGLPSLQVQQDTVYAEAALPEPWLADVYRHGDVHRVIAAEHSSLLERAEREQLEARFKAGSQTRRPWDENLLSATPTLEMGVDIGDLSSVLLCSVPPTQASYLQRIGRSGRRDGNALSLSIAAGDPHDLYFYAEPHEMMAGRVHPPGVFLNASAVLFRQLTAYCLDRWVATGIDDSAIPAAMRNVLDAVERYDAQRFPYTFERFIHENPEPLLQGFVDLLKDNLTERTRQALRDFVYGTQTDDGLRVRLVKRLLSVAEERKVLRTRAETMKREIERLRRQPDDEATQNQIDEADRERQGLLGILSKINSKNVLAFLVDEGLLPNYAFPEAGVLLRSIIWRRRRKPQPGERPTDSRVFEYERPAAAALSELAPENRFYAGGRRVQISQIDLGLSSVEKWRLCPTCTHAENVEAGDHHVACPNCQNPHWADIDQLKTMVRLRQVVANTEDSRSRIGDDAEDREPTFYTRQMLADFSRQDVDLAYRLVSDVVPFGFEFIRSVTFREINFGEYGRTVLPTFVAGQEAARPGFRICRQCGTVQRPPRRNTAGQPATPQEHTHNCPARERDDAAAIIDCLYLYREFKSEGLRILLPLGRAGADERGLQSFIAAIQLGLRLQFSGKVDHLRMTTYDEPERGSTRSRKYLLLYDSVPGGTGYLHELLRDASTLLEVFRRARDRMVACVCNQDAEKDGCYQCLYAYRNSHGMEETSRSSAVALLSEILDASDRLERVATISDIDLNPAFDSALEARFIEALRRLGARDGNVQVQQEVVRGKPGYFVTIGTLEYLIEPQVEVGPSQGVTVPCKPDFVIWPARVGQTHRPIAVFLDGFEAHRARVTDDTLKRLALVQSAAFWIWTITWYDISAAFSPGQDDLKQLLVDGQHPQAADFGRQVAVKLDAGSLQRKLAESPLMQLLAWLESPVEHTWRAAVFAQAMGWFDPQISSSPDMAQRLREWFERKAPGPLGELARQETEASAGGIGWSGSPAAIQARCLLPHRTLKPPVSPESLLAVLLFDPRLCGDEAALKLAWRRFFSAANLLQFLPRAAWVTEDGLERGIYEQAGWAWALGRTAPSATPGAGFDPWEIVASEVWPAWRGMLLVIANQISEVPTVAYELQNELGEIVAEAELAWSGAKVCVLRAQQAESAAFFEAAGWNAIPGDDGWADHLLAILRPKGQS